ncbi:hypothetical protein HPB50_012687 [Hyalomma asiaticum]|uniref:Uncharacterized protein n=1 Tax=Hyalomma asiaticum TaxID=266040 RepID=A0ACB7TGK0_HYAAI|nr:hypothetical protein HPB50_012687 [Hyalomma asiaticum]
MMSVVTSASLYMFSTAKAECSAIAWVIIDRQRKGGEACITIISDSQEAARHFMNGRIPLKIAFCWEKN